MGIWPETIKRKKEELSFTISSYDEKPITAEYDSRREEKVGIPSSTKRIEFINKTYEHQS